ncbi:permease-like cell division protein FtsX [Lactococcus petauri]
MIRNLFKHLLESLKNLRRNGWMTVAAVSSVMITLTLVGLFLSVILNTAKLSSDIEKNVRIVAYMDLNIHDMDKKIEDPKNPKKEINNPNYRKIYSEIEKIPDVASIKFSSKDEQLKQLTETLGSTWALFQSDANPLYDAYIVEADNPQDVEKVASAIKKINGIQSANYGGANTERILALGNNVKIWGGAAAALLILVAVFLISNTIRITIMSRQREIQIMRLVGARNGYIRWPFFLEGAWVGLLGAIVPSVLIAWLYNLAFTSFTPSLKPQSLYLLPADTFVPMMVGLLFLIGILIGSLGAVTSMRRFLKV